MTQPTPTPHAPGDPPPPPETIGLQPINAAEVNNKIGRLLQDFKTIKARINDNADYLGTVDLTAAPIFMTADQQTTLKSAVVGLDDQLDDVDMTFINRVTGLS